MAKCRPSKYAVIGNGGVITHGFRCAKHKIYTRRFASEALRDQRLKEHQQEQKKN